MAGQPNHTASLQSYTDVKNKYSPKNGNLVKISSASGHMMWMRVFFVTRFGEMLLSITCSLMNALQ